MNFKKITEADIQYFSGFLNAKNILSDEESLVQNSHDETEDLTVQPELVLLPETTEDVSRILSYCNKNKICITPRGAGTGLSGGAIPVFGGISLDFRKMNKILFIDENNFQVTTQPGVITEVLQNALSAKNLFYPVDPASRGSCFIGGNIAENSGGPRAVKYGTVKDYVLNLEAVLPDGQIIQTGANTLKNATGYNLTQLLVGSEGTLAVITKITLKLLPCPTQRLLLLAPFKSAKTACIAVNKIMKAGIIPSALEFMERDALLSAQAYLGESPVAIPDDVQAHLLIEIDGYESEQLSRESEKIYDILSKLTEEEILFADNAQQQDSLWRLRRVVGEAAKKSAVYKEEDTVVPRSYLPDLLDFVKRTGAKYGFQSICYGHAGDGNLHVNILKTGISDKQWTETLPLAIKEIFTFVKSKGGTLSGEHGIGLVQKQYMSIVFSPAEIAIMKAIKESFDPNGILNPGKIFPV